MVDPNGQESHQIFYSYWLFIASIFRPCCWSPIVQAARVLYFQYWLYKIPH